jgi:regulator of sirC expression with transglutaminase-like and TPR domain
MIADATGRQGDIVDALRLIGRCSDDKIDLGEAALLLAALDLPNTGLSRYRDHLAEIAVSAASRITDNNAPDLTGRAHALSAAIGGEAGYCGDTETYNDPGNANLMHVMDRRKGLPVTLSIIYLDVARRLDWSATGLNFPGHFLIRVERDALRVILDPFNAGTVCDVVTLRALLKRMTGMDAELTPDHYEAIGNRETLIRLLNNIKLRAEAAGDVEVVAEAVERMRLIAPDRLALSREAGLCHARAGHLKRAVESLEYFIEHCEDNAQRNEALSLLRHVRGRIN